MVTDVEVFNRTFFNITLIPSKTRKILLTGTYLLIKIYWVLSSNKYKI